MDRLFDALLAFLGEHWPFRTVHVYEQGVRFWCGRDVALLTAPGIYFTLPFVGQIEVVSCVPEVISIPVQSVTTKDDIAVTLSANVTLRTTDARVLWTSVHDFNASVRNVIENHINRRVRELTWAELLQGQTALERSMRGTLTTRVKAWGAEVEDVGLGSITRARAYRLFGAPSFGA